MMEMKHPDARKNTTNAQTKPFADKFEIGPNKMLKQISPEAQATLNNELVNAAQTWSHGLNKVKTALENGADVNARTEFDQTALMRAAGIGYIETINVLIAARAKINATTETGWTALMFAALNGNTEAVKVLIAAGADVNARGVDGNTALSLAATYTKTAQVLREAGAKE